MTSMPRSRPLLATAFAVLISIPLTGCGKDLKDEPLYAVDQYLLDAGIDGGGLEACRYLTPAEQHAASNAAGGIDCGQALNGSGLTIGGEQISSAAELHALASRTVVDGNRARVRLTRSGAAVDFQLLKANPAEQDEFQPPDTEWRIAKGALVVLR